MLQPSDLDAIIRPILPILTVGVLILFVISVIELIPPRRKKITIENETKESIGRSTNSREEKWRRNP